MTTLLIVVFAFGLASVVGAWIAAYAMITKSSVFGPASTTTSPVLDDRRAVVGSYV